MSLGTAITISGAAANPNMGYWGVPLSLFVQGMQTPLFLSPGPSYYACTALALRLTADTNWNLGLSAWLGTQLQYSWQSDRTITTFGLNLVPLVLLNLLVAKVEEPSYTATTTMERAA